MLVLFVRIVLSCFVEQAETLRSLKLVVVLDRQFHVKFLDILNTFKKTLVLQALYALAQLFDSLMVNIFEVVMDIFDSRT